MRGLKSIVAAVMTVVMLACFSVSTFAIFDDVTYADVSEMYGTTMSEPKTMYIKFVDALGIIAGETNGTYTPMMKITRGEALQIVYRMLHYDYDELKDYGSKNTGFDEGNGGDIGDADILKPYIAWAEDYQLVNAEYVPEKQFKSADYITGAEFITLIGKAIMLGQGGEGGEDEAAEMADALATILDGTDVAVDSEFVYKEQAAVVVANAIMYDPEVDSIDQDMFTYFSYDGKRLNCLATNVFGCNYTDLVIRATKEIPMNYENVSKDMLLSNGVQVDTGSDMSDFVGYPLRVIYQDTDKSGTFTEDENMITYEMTSPIRNEFELAEITFTTYHQMTGTKDQENVSIYSNTMMYLNGDLWPMEDAYKLSEQIYLNYGEISAANLAKLPVAAISNRPNLSFVTLNSGSADNADTVYATEWIPGRVMTVTENYYGIYSFYDNQIHIFEDNNIEFSNLTNLKSGDYVNFYEAGSKVYITTGKSVILKNPILVTDAEKKITYLMDDPSKAEDEKTETAETAGTEETVEKPKKAEDFLGEEEKYIPHFFAEKGLGDNAYFEVPKVEDENGELVEQDNGIAYYVESGAELLVVLDYTGTTYIAVQKAPATNEIAAEVTDIQMNADGVTANIGVKELATGKISTLENVPVENITSADGSLNAFDYCTYYKTTKDEIFMYVAATMKMTAIETEDYFVIEGGKKLLKTEDFVSDNPDQFYAGEVTLVVDRYDGVRRVYGA